MKRCSLIIDVPLILSIVFIFFHPVVSVEEQNMRRMHDTKTRLILIKLLNTEGRRRIGTIFSNFRGN